MKKIIRICLWLLIGICSFIIIDGLCARVLKTKPIIAHKEVVVQGGSIKEEVGYVYKSLFADVYYCSTIYEYYRPNEDDYDDISIVKEEVITRHYQKKNAEFMCPVWINERSDIYENYQMEAKKYKDSKYLSLIAKGDYMARYFGKYNKKLNMLTLNFIGDNDIYFDTLKQDIYMFDVNDFSLEPVRLVIDGFDMAWRALELEYSPSGETMVFKYFCGYRDEQWMGEQKYTKEDCDKNSTGNGFYAFRVNGVNDYTQISYLEDSVYENKLGLYDRFVIYDYVDDNNIIFKHIIAKDATFEPDEEVYYKWDIINDTFEELEV